LAQDLRAEETNNEVRMIWILMIWTKLLMAQNCTEPLGNDLSLEVQNFFQHIEGEYQLGSCKIVIQGRKECIDNHEWFYAETYVNDGEEEVLANFAISDDDSTASWLHIHQGQFHFRDYQRFENPRVYQSFHINFSPNMRRAEIQYKSYHMEYRPIRKHYHQIIRCSGPNPWVNLEDNAIFNEQKNRLSQLFYSLRAAFNGELQYRD
tara:strand:+ start:7699 stop:8319 length:621 start_codon:yes stop_codon:yes gene_type:complete